MGKADDPKVVARGLSEAQRRVLSGLHLRKNGWVGRGKGRAAKALREKGLVEDHSRFAFGYQLTPLGLAVRNLSEVERRD